jgi:hypothetical protein
MHRADGVADLGVDLAACVADGLARDPDVPEIVERVEDRGAWFSPRAVRLPRAPNPRVDRGLARTVRDPGTCSIAYMIDKLAPITWTIALP